MNRYVSTIPALLAAALLAACGGGTGGLNSAGSEAAPGPAPGSGPIRVTSQTIISRTPLPQTVATTAGTYDTVAWVGKQAFDRGAAGAITGGLATISPIHVTVDPTSPAFTIRAQFPDGEIQRTYVGNSAQPLYWTNEFYGDFGYRIEFVFNFSDGTKSDIRTQDIISFVADAPIGTDQIRGRLQTSPTTYETSVFRTEMGLRYVSYGEWAGSEFATDSAGTRQTSTQIAKFVYGARTAPSDVPASGKAQYSDEAGFLHLDADFGARKIAANLDYPAKVIVSAAEYGEIRDVVVGVKASGSSAITAAGDFWIPLTGTSITPDAAQKLPDVIEPVTGTFAGAFFGPRAVEAGGLAEVVKANGDPLWSGVPFLLGLK